MRDWFSQTHFNYYTYNIHRTMLTGLGFVYLVLISDYMISQDFQSDMIISASIRHHIILTSGFVLLAPISVYRVLYSFYGVMIKQISWFCYTRHSYRYVHSCSKVMGFFFQTQKNLILTLCRLQKYRHKYEMFCDIHTRFDKISQSRYGSVTSESRVCSTKLRWKTEMQVSHTKEIPVSATTH